MSASNSDALVVYGVTGDLAHKMIFPALYAMVKRGALNIAVVGVAFPKWTLERLQKRVTHSIEQSGGIDNKRAFHHLLSLLKYVSGDYNDSDTFASIKQSLGRARRPAHYLAIPPSLFETVIEGLGAAKLAENARVIVEKPFGRDLASARARLQCADHFVRELRGREAWQVLRVRGLLAGRYREPSLSDCRAARHGTACRPEFWSSAN